MGYERERRIYKYRCSNAKYFDQAISGNWSYNPENYEDNQVPVSIMASRPIIYLQVWLEDFILSKYL